MTEQHRRAASIVEAVLGRRGSIRNLCFARAVQRKAAVYALVVETLRFRVPLSMAVRGGDSDGSLRHAFARHPGLLLVLCYELLLGRHAAPSATSSSSAAAAAPARLFGGRAGWAVRAVKDRCAALRAAWARLLVAQGIDRPMLLLPPHRRPSRAYRPFFVW